MSSVLPATKSLGEVVPVQVALDSDALPEDAPELHAVRSRLPVVALST